MSDARTGPTGWDHCGKHNLDTYGHQDECPMCVQDNRIAALESELAEERTDREGVTSDLVNDVMIARKQRDAAKAEVARLREVVDCVRVLRVSPSVGGGGAEYNARRLLYDLLQALAQEDQT